MPAAYPPCHLTYDTNTLKPIPGHRQYVINNNGTIVRRIASDKLIRSWQLQPAMQNQYLAVTLATKDKARPDGSIYDACANPIRTYIHRLVALAWISLPTTGKPWINHKDGNKLNNHFSNLEWSSISDNIQHAYDTGLHPIKRGIEHPRCGSKHSILVGK